MILSDLQQQISDLARDFARDRLAPGAAKRDREHLFPREELKEMGELGL
ncbi:acyl-CoA dehydrogenase family protein, partial [Rhizobium ruizarguesonis]